MKITIEELADKLDLLIWECGKMFLITEEFVKKGKQSYFLSDLHIEIDNGIVCCWDNENIICDSNFMLYSFLSKSLIDICEIIDNNTICYKLIFYDGNILIYPTKQ